MDEKRVNAEVVELSGLENGTFEHPPPGERTWRSSLLARSSLPTLLVTILAAILLLNCIRSRSSSAGPATGIRPVPDESSPSTTLRHIPGDAFDPLIPIPRCDSAGYTHDISHAIAVDNEHFSFHVAIEEALSTTNLPGKVSGKVHVMRGELEQAKSFLIQVHMASTSPAILDVAVDLGPQGVRITGPESSRTPALLTHAEACTSIIVNVYVRPTTLMLGRFSIDTSILAIELARTLCFEINNVSLASATGSIASSELSTFFPKEVSVATQRGSIVGSWSLPAAISLTTRDQPIDINLVHKTLDPGPWTPGAVSASSTSGDIAIHMPFTRDKLALLNATFDVTSDSGSINCTLVHAASTSLITDSGSIQAELLPFYGLQARGSIVTASRNGSTNVHVLSPIISTHWPAHPMNYTWSWHTQWIGTMQIRYPPEWLGVVGMQSNSGELNISGPDVEILVPFDHLKWAMHGSGSSFIRVASDTAPVTLCIEGGNAMRSVE